MRMVTPLAAAARMAALWPTGGLFNYGKIPMLLYIGPSQRGRGLMSYDGEYMHTKGQKLSHLKGEGIMMGKHSVAIHLPFDEGGRIISAVTNWWERNMMVTIR